MPRYGKDNSGIIDDIHQVSNYARDVTIISHFNDDPNETKVYPCLLIYSEKQDPDDLKLAQFNQEVCFLFIIALI